MRFSVSSAAAFVAILASPVLSRAAPVEDIALEPRQGVAGAVWNINEPPRIWNASPTPFLATESGHRWIFQFSYHINVSKNDGNFVIYDPTGGVSWSSRTYGNNCPTGNSACRLAWQNDGNFVIYINERVRWSTGTAHKGLSLQLFPEFGIRVTGDGGRILYRAYN